MRHPILWWLALVTTVLVSIVALAVMPGSVASSMGLLLVILAPLSLCVIFENRSLPGIFLPIVTITAATLANATVHLASPLSAPLLETLAYATSAAIAVLAIGILICNRLSPLKPPALFVGFFSFLAIGTQFAVASLSAPTALTSGPSAFVFGACLCGIPLVLLILDLGRPRKRWQYTDRYVAVMLFAWTFISMSILFFNAYAKFSDVRVARYQLDLTFDESSQHFVANEWILAEFVYRNEGDVDRDLDEEIAPWDRQQAIRDTLRRDGLERFEVVSTQYEINDPVTLGDRLQLHRVSRLPGQPDGLLYRTSAFQLPRVLGLTPAVASAGPDPAIQIQVRMPENFGLTHNLEGQSSRVVDADGRATVQVFSREVKDIWAVVRLRYPVSSLRNEYFSRIAQLIANPSAKGGLAIALGVLMAWLTVTVLRAGNTGSGRSGPRIFINYRRGDEPGFTQALFQQLNRTLRPANIFMDVEGDIEPGDEFTSVLHARINACDVVLVVIGPAWLDLRDGQGLRRLDDANDWVRVEIASALANDKLVIPVLVGGARLPNQTNLPEDIKPLPLKQAVELRATSFGSDAQRLIQFLVRYRPSKKCVRRVNSAERRPPLTQVT